MSLNNLNCKEIFKEAYNNRYTWPNNFNGYSGKCIFIDNQKSFEGEFTLDSNFKPKITNIEDNNISNGYHLNYLKLLFIELKETSVRCTRIIILNF
tara:strand:- start:251 stop:538 length:288 start_codon:yes stop_codon:yes gene_type:complete